MGKRYEMSAEQIQEMETARKKNGNKNVERRLHTLLLYAQGVKREEIAIRTGIAYNYICPLIAKYRDGGISAIVDNHYAGNRRNLTYEEEEALLCSFRKQAEEGHIVETKAILKAYEAKLGRTFEKDSSRIYRVLERHGWRKIMPRSKHPKKASEEEITIAKNKIICGGTTL